eukprot:gene7056-7803_t
MEINDRKKAKEAYLQQLAQQKAQAAQASGGQPKEAGDGGLTESHQPVAPVVSSGSSKLSKREQLLEEKRRAFFQQKQERKPSHDDASIFQPAVPAVPISLPQQLSQNTPVSSFSSAIQESAAIPQLGTSVAKENVAENARLSDWKRLGYPSEYSYAKHLGLLNEKQPTDAVAGTDRTQDQSFSVHVPTSGVSGASQYTPYAPIGLPQLPLPSSTTSSAPTKPVNNDNASGGLQIGKVEDAQSKRARQEEYAVELRRQQELNNAKNFHPNGYQGGNNGGGIGTGWEDKTNGSGSGSGGGFDGRSGPIPSAVNGQNDREAKRMQQADYARSLQEQIDNRSQNQNQQFKDSIVEGAPSYQNSEASGSGGLQIGKVEDAQSKRARQEQYAADLRRQMNHAGNGEGDRGDNKGIGGGGLAYDDSRRNVPLNRPTEGFAIGQQIDKDTKKKQQAEYARALQEDQNRHQQAVNPSNAGRNQDNGRLREPALSQANYFNPPMLDPRGGLNPNVQATEQGNNRGFMIGNGEDAQAKRARQEQYAADLRQQQDMSRPTYLPEVNKGMGGGGLAYDDSRRNVPLNRPTEGFAIGQQIDKDTKKKQQAEYARALQEDQTRRQQAVNPSNAGQNFDNKGPINSFPKPTNNYAVSAMPSNNAMIFPEYERLGNEGGGRVWEDRGGDYAYDRMPRINNEVQAAAGGLLFGQQPDKEAKRRQQEEYARALNQQLGMKSDDVHKASNAGRKLSPRVPQGGGGGEGALEPGWTMGPLGVPVRKTLQTGRRDLQKAFIAGAQLSPEKPGGFFQSPQQPVSMLGNGVGMAMPMGDVQAITAEGIIGLSDRQDEIKARRIFQAQLLEQQIADNKARAKEAEEKQKEEDMKLEMKLEKERLEIEAAFERERTEKKKQAELNAKRDLEMQIERQKKQKEDDDLSRKREEEEEERRLERERENLQRQQEEEMRREQAEKMRQQQYNQQQQQHKHQQALPQSKEKLFDAPSQQMNNQNTSNRLPTPPTTKAPHWEEPHLIKPSSRAAARASLWDPSPLPLSSEVSEIFAEPTSNSHVQANYEQSAPASATRRRQIAHAEVPSSSSRWKTPSLDSEAFPEQLPERHSRPSSSSSAQHVDHQRHLPPRTNISELRKQMTWQQAQDVDLSSSLNRTLKGESRFLMPDGREIDSAWPLPELVQPSRPIAMIDRTSTISTQQESTLKEDKSTQCLSRPSSHTYETRPQSQPLPAVQKNSVLQLISENIPIQQSRPLSGIGNKSRPNSAQQSPEKAIKTREIQQDEFKQSGSAKINSSSSSGTSQFVDGVSDEKEKTRKVSARVPTLSLQNVADALPAREEKNEPFSYEGFDVEKELRKSRRKWQLLQRLNDVHNAASVDAQGLFGNPLEEPVDEEEDEEDAARSYVQPSARRTLARAGQFSMRTSFSSAEPSSRAPSRSNLPVSSMPIDIYSEFGL